MGWIKERTILRTRRTDGKKKEKKGKDGWKEKGQKRHEGRKKGGLEGRQRNWKRERKSKREGEYKMKSGLDGKEIKKM